MTGLRPGTPVGVVGGGAMGAGIAQVAAQAGHPVTVVEVSTERAAAAQETVATGLRRAAEKGRVADLDAALAGVVTTTDLGALAGCPLVVEAVAEDVAVKQDLFARLEAVVGPDAVLATNTSSLAIESVAAGLARPGRVVGMHFFNPAPVMRLVEVVSGLATEPAVAALVADVATAWGKEAVHCPSTPGFLVNRVARPFYAVALEVAEETGADPAVLDRHYREAGGFRLGPFELTDLIGQDVNAAVTRSVWTATGYDPRYRPSGLQERYVAAGWLGRKSGRGFHAYPGGGSVERPPLPAPVGGPVRVGPGCAVRELLARAGVPLEDDPGLGPWAVLADGTRVALTDGDLAAAHAARLGHPVALLDLVLDPAGAASAGAAGSSPAALDALAAVLAGGDVAVTPLPDVPGLLLARTVALLADEACALVGRGAADPATVDRAVRLGLGYPLGPLEWADRLGPARLVALLDVVERLLPGGRHRVTPALRRAASAGAALRAL